MDDSIFIIRIKQGHIKGNINDDGTWYISEFIIYKKYRKQGFGKRLASLFPPACDLIASPIDRSPECLDYDALIKFYRKFGFRFENVNNGIRNWTRKKSRKKKATKKKNFSSYPSMEMIQGL